MEQLAKMVEGFFVCIYKLKSDLLQSNIIRRFFFHFARLYFLLLLLLKKHSASNRL